MKKSKISKSKPQTAQLKSINKLTIYKKWQVIT